MVSGGNSLAEPSCAPAVSFLFGGLTLNADDSLRLDDGLLAISSLTRALGGNAELADIGSLLWMLIRQIVPCDAMALFLPDETHDHVVVRFAAGAHAHALRGVTRPTATGLAGWVAVNRTPILNGEPILDLGFRAETSPALRASIVVPLVESDAVVAVMALYSKELLAFSDEHVRVLELLAPKLAGALVDAVIADEDSLYPVTRPVASLRLVKSR
jgi:GAF domain-containing protein